MALNHVKLYVRLDGASMICGWGINDAVYVTKRCLIYRCWQDMIKRCHCSKYQIKRPAYIGCWVDERWRSFMIFRAWYLEQNPKLGDQLDKDFLRDGKLYSPETCYFVPGWLNNLFTDRGAKRGDWPQGVSKYKWKFKAGMRYKGKDLHLGYFDTPVEASAAYLKAKAAYVEELILENPHRPPRLVAAIRRKMADLYARESTTQRPNTMPIASPKWTVPL